MAPSLYFGLPEADKAPRPSPMQLQPHLHTPPAELSLVREPRLRDIFLKVADGQRVDADDALYLYETPDIQGLGVIADWLRR